MSNYCSLAEALRQLTKAVRVFVDDGRLEKDCDLSTWPEDLRDAFWALCDANDAAEDVLKKEERP